MQAQPENKLLRNVSNVTTKGSFLERRLSILTTSRSTTEPGDQLRGPLGLNLLYEPLEPIVDFIFVSVFHIACDRSYRSTAELFHGRCTDCEAGLGRPGVPQTTLLISGPKSGFQQILDSSMSVFTASATTRTGARRKEVYSTSMILDGVYLVTFTPRRISGTALV